MFDRIPWGTHQDLTLSVLKVIKYWFISVIDKGLIRLFLLMWLLAKCIFQGAASYFCYFFQGLWIYRHRIKKEDRSVKMTEESLYRNTENSKCPHDLRVCLFGGYT